MRKIVLFIVFLLLFVWSCKKNNTPQPSNTNTNYNPFNWQVKLTNNYDGFMDFVIADYKIENGILYFSSVASLGVHAFDLSSKKVLWSYPGWWRFVIVGNKVLVVTYEGYSFGDTIVALDKNTGQVISNFPIIKCDLGGIARNSTKLFVFYDDSLMAYDLNNFSRVWTTEIAYKNRIYSAYTVLIGANNNYVLLYYGDTLYNLDANTGKVVWKRGFYFREIRGSVYSYKIITYKDYAIVARGTMGNLEPSFLIIVRLSTGDVVFSSYKNFTYYTMFGNKLLIQEDGITCISIEPFDTLFKISDPNINPEGFVTYTDNDDVDMNLVVDTVNNLFLHSYYNGFVGFDGRYVIRLPDTLYVHSLTNPSQVLKRIPLGINNHLAGIGIIYNGELIVGIVKEGSAGDFNYDAYLVGISY